MQQQEIIQKQKKEGKQLINIEDDDPEEEKGKSNLKAIQEVMDLPDDIQLRGKGEKKSIEDMMEEIKNKQFQSQQAPGRKQWNVAKEKQPVPEPQTRMSGLDLLEDTVPTNDVIRQTAFQSNV